MIAISIRGHGPFMGEIETRADDPAVVWVEYAAPENAQLDDPEAWALANPGLESGIKSMAYMEDQSRRALAIPAVQAHFRAHDLNRPANPAADPIVGVSDWTQCVVGEDDLPAMRGRCVIGFDAGGSTSMTAAAIIWINTGRFETLAAFPSKPGLLERGRLDGVGDLYQRMEDRGELRRLGGRVTDLPLFLSHVRARVAGSMSRVLAIGFDRYRKAEIVQALEDASLGSWPRIARGTGASATADGSHDVISFQRAVMSERIASPESLLMASAIRDSELRYDGAGNPAIDKRRHRGRIDVLSAAVIAAGLAQTAWGKPDRGVSFAVAG